MWRGRYGEAEAVFRDALRTEGDDTSWRLNLGSALAQLGPAHAVEAEQRFREVLAMDPANLRAWEELQKLGKHL